MLGLDIKLKRRVLLACTLFFSQDTFYSSWNKDAIYLLFIRLLSDCSPRISRIRSFTLVVLSKSVSLHERLFILNRIATVKSDGC